MSDIRINALTTTATSSASDDYVAIDGSANGTRKLSAYSPTFGGNLTVSGDASIGTNVFKIDSANVRILFGLAGALQGDTVEIAAKANSGAISLFGRASDNLSTLAFRANGASTQKAFIAGGNSGLQLGSGSSNGLTIDTSQNVAITGNLTVSGGTVTSGTGTLTLNSSANTVVLQSAGTTALTLDSSQNATFAGTVQVGSSQSAGCFLVESFSSNAVRIGSRITGSQAGALHIVTSNTSNNYIVAAKFNADQTFTLPTYGAGTLSTDASGNVTASSDARLKTNLRTFARGLADVLKLAPKTYNWNETSGMDTASDYVGFVAQDVQSAIPEAVYEGKDANKTLTLNDRAILAALVNAVKELNAKLA